MAFFSAGDKLYVVSVNLEGDSVAVDKLYKKITRYKVYIGNGRKPLGSLNRGADVRGKGIEIFIRVLLVIKTAHKSSAAARNFSRVKRETLLLCHFYPNRLEVAQKPLTAVGLTADTHTAEQLCLVPSAYLP